VLESHAVDPLPGRRVLGGQRMKQTSACCRREVEARGDEGGVALKVGNHRETIAAVLLRASGYEGAHDVCEGDRTGGKRAVFG